MNSHSCLGMIEGQGGVLYMSDCVCWLKALNSHLPCLSFYSPSLLVMIQFGRTEVIDNTLNPDFVRKYILDYFFEEKQNLRFDVWVILFDLALWGYIPRCVCVSEVLPSSNKVLQFNFHYKVILFFSHHSPLSLHPLNLFSIFYFSL